MGWNDHIMGPGYEHLREDDEVSAPDNYDTLFVQRGAEEAFRVAADDARKLRYEAAEHVRWVLLNTVDKHTLGEYKKALQRIATNTCCYVCQEAAKVAQAAIAKAEGK
jgi:hypothetical protein